MPRYWSSEVRQTAGSAAAITIYSARNEHQHSILIKSCTAKSSGAVSTEGVSIFRDRNGKNIPVYHDKAALTAAETTSIPRPFLLLPGERIGVTFDACAAATDVLELVAFGEHGPVMEPCY
jgi:hypothetical protein